ARTAKASGLMAPTSFWRPQLQPWRNVLTSRLLLTGRPCAFRTDENIGYLPGRGSGFPVSDHRPLRRRVALFPEPGHVQGGQKDQRQHGRSEQPPHDRKGHRSPEHGRSDGYHAKNRGYGGQHDRTESRAAGVHGGVPGTLALSTLRVHLSDQYHRVLADHPEQRKHPENCYKAQRTI